MIKDVFGNESFESLDYFDTIAECLKDAKTSIANAKPTSTTSTAQVQRADNSLQEGAIEEENKQGDRGSNEILMSKPTVTIPKLTTPSRQNNNATTSTTKPKEQTSKRKFDAIRSNEPGTEREDLKKVKKNQVI